MSADAQRAAFQHALAETDRRLRACPDDLELQFERARLLTSLGDDAGATSAYLAILHREPAHFGALTNIGALALAAGHRGAALTAYRQAAATHPNFPAAHVNLANLLMASGNAGDARRHFEAALALDPACVEAHRALVGLLLASGDEAGSDEHLCAAMQGPAIVSLPCRGAADPVRVLMLVSLRGGNIPTEQMLNERTHDIQALYLEAWDERMTLPAHDLVFNAVGDADLCAAALAKAGRIAERTTAPVINRPDAVRATTRENNAARFASAPGIVAPLTRRLPRAALESLEACDALARLGFSYPLLLRATGFHTGQHFVRVEGPGELRASVAQLPGRDVLAIQPLYARSQDGLWRKYRVMFIGGALYPLHMAASTDWKVHYFTSAMATRPDLRAREQQFLDAMTDVLGPRATTALERLAAMLGLDYGGIDFALSRDGDLLLFEANATMVMVPPGPDPIWDYRRAAIARAQDAARALFTRPAQRF
ncbi:MAG TPA: tetratricopeptide repeat protein [Rhizomicrobium sp.]